MRQFPFPLQIWILGYVVLIARCSKIIILKVKYDRLYDVTLWRFRPNHCYGGNKTVHCVCVRAVEKHVTVNSIRVPSVPQQCFYDKFVAGNNKTYVGLNVNCPMLYCNKRIVVRLMPSLGAKFRYTNRNDIYIYIYIYIYMCVCVCVCVYIYIYIYIYKVKQSRYRPGVA